MAEDGATEKPTTEEVGRLLGFLGADEDGLGGRKREAQDTAILGGAGADRVTSGSAVEVSWSAVVGCEGEAGSEGSLAFAEDAASESEVLVDCGEPGDEVLGAVEHAGVVSVVVVAAEDVEG